MQNRRNCTEKVNNLIICNVVKGLQELKENI